jgi:hypothetical protein
MKIFSAVLLGVVASCGRDNLNNKNSVPDVVSQATQEQESGAMGIVGGTALTASSPLIPYMRAVRHRFQMNGNSGNVSNGGDRFCSGVAVAKNAVVTAAHCIELQNNAGEYILTGFNPNTTLPIGFGSRRLFYGHKLDSHPLPLMGSSTNYTANPNYGVVDTSVYVSYGTSIRSADVGFLYDWNNAAPAVAPLCTELPALGAAVTVTGIKVTYKTGTAVQPASYYLGWAEYQAKIIQVTARPTTYLKMSSPRPAVWSYTSPTFTPTTTSTAMEFVTEALDPLKNCTEGGDSGGGVFLTRADGSRCLLGINSARGSTVNLGTRVACTPTMHRRVIPEMLASIPDAPTTGGAQEFIASSTVNNSRPGEFARLMKNFPAGTFVPMP